MTIIEGPGEHVQAHNNVSMSIIFLLLFPAFKKCLYFCWGQVPTWKNGGLYLCLCLLIHVSVPYQT